VTGGGYGSRRHSPDFPPAFSSNRIDCIVMPRSTALHMRQGMAVAEQSTKGAHATSG
jgi:hypothetical protein